jgi:hypothetical protein
MRVSTLRRKRTAQSITQCIYSPVSRASLQKKRSFLGFGWRLLGILGPNSSSVGLQRLLAMRKAPIWRAFLIEESIFSENETAWLGRKDSNLRMVESKSPIASIEEAR